MRALRRTLPFVLLLVLLPLSASAGRFTLVPSLVVTGEWTDNLLLTPEESDHAKLSDFSVTAFPGLALTYDSYRTHAFVGAGVGFRHYFRYDQFDGWPEYYNGTAGWAYWLSPLVRLTFTDALVYYTDPRDQPFSTSTSAVESLRTESLANTIGVSTLYTITRLSTVEAGYSFGTTEFRNELLDDVVEHAAFATFTQRISPSYNMVLFYDFNRALFSPHYDFFRRFVDHRYSMRPSFPVKLKDPNDFDTHIPGAGMIFTASPTLSFDVRAGVILPCVRRNDAYEMDHPDWYQRLTILKVFQHANLVFSYTRSVAPAHGLAGAVLTQTVASSFSQRWTQHFETTEEADYTNYLQPAANIDAGRGAVEADYYFFNWLGTGLAYSYLGQVGHLGEGAPDQHINAQRVTLHVTLAPPSPNWLRF